MAATKEQKRQYQNAYKKTKDGVISRIYADQRKSSKKRGHRPPEYTKKALVEWVYSQTLFHELYDEWVQSGHLKSLKPSIDRKYDDIHYCIKNIQLMTWGENNKKGNLSIRAGNIIHGNNPQKSVIQLSINGEIINTFVSQSEASRVTSVFQAGISLCCLGKQKSAGGFLWEFTKNNDTERISHR